MVDVYEVKSFEIIYWANNLCWFSVNYQTKVGLNHNNIKMKKILLWGAIVKRKKKKICVLKTAKLQKGQIGNSSRLTVYFECRIVGG